MTCGAPMSKQIVCQSRRSRPRHWSWNWWVRRRSGLRRATRDSYPLLARADARRLAYWRRILTWLPQPSMLHQRRLPFLLPS
jgi:hypothetical protein